MSIKTILVSLNEVSRNEQAINATLSLAGEHQAHVIGLYVIPAIQIYPGPGLYVPAEINDSYNAFFKTHAEKERARFDEAVRKQGASGEWREVETVSSMVADGITEHAFQADLVIISKQPEGSSAGTEKDCVQSVIMTCGRPVLVIPADGSIDKIGANVLVAWNGTRESARAVFDAIPLLSRAQDVFISWFNPSDDLPGDEPLAGAEMATTLSRHGISATAQSLASGGQGIGDTLLSHAQASGADLLVMGAYGHSRMREMVFGGATKAVLAHMNVPVLMSH